MARLAVHRSETDQDGTDVLRWVDRMLIRLVSSHFTGSSFSLKPLTHMNSMIVVGDRIEDVL